MTHPRDDEARRIVDLVGGDHRAAFGIVEGQLAVLVLRTQVLRRMTEIANDLGVTMAQLALAWILRRPEISSVITGATKLSHVHSNAAAADITLSDDTLAQLNALFPA